MTFFAALLLAVATPPAEHEPIEIPPPAPIHGLVVDEDGRPVEGAELFLSGLPEDFRSIARQTSWTGRSDAQGRFVAETSSFRLAGASSLPWSESITAFRPGSRPAVVRIGRSGTSPANPLRFVLRPVAAAGVPLRVIDPGGIPVAGARIIDVRIATGPELVPSTLLDRFSVSTGTDGRANLSAFSPEDVLGVTIESKAFGSQHLTTDPKAGGEQTLTLQAVGRLSGRVVVDDPGEAGGLAVVGITSAYLTPGGRGGAGHFEVTTDADGRFEVPALAAGSLIILSRTGRANLIRDQSKAKPVEVVAGKTAEVEVVMKAGVPIRGVLRERGSRRPIAGATVNLSSRGGGSRFARTDRAGQFKGFLLPGDLDLSVDYAGPYVLAEESRLKLGTLSADDREFDAGVVEVVRGVNVRVVVRDELGKPVPGAEIDGRTSSGGRSVLAGQSLGTSPVSDARGEFVMENLAPGHPVEVTARLGEAGTETPTVVTPGEAEGVTLVVSPANTVSLGGRVVDEYGRPIAGAMVGINSRWKTSTGAGAGASPYFIFSASKIVTDAQGRFQVPRTLSRHAQHQAEATAPGRPRNRTEWFASTTRSFFDLTLFSTSPPEQSQIRTDYDMGWAANRVGDYAEAEARFRSALKGASEKKITDPLQLSWWHEGLSCVLINRGQLAEGEKEAHIVLELREKALPADHPELARALRLLADDCMRQEKFDEAERLQGKALAIIERGSGPDHPESGRTLFASGHLAILRGQNADAVPLLERAGQVLETAFGPDHAELIDVLIDRGYALNVLERLDEAEPVFRRVLKLAEQIEATGGPKTADAVARLANVLRREGKDAEADDLEARPRRNPGR